MYTNNNNNNNKIMYCGLTLLLQTLIRHLCHPIIEAFFYVYNIVIAIIKLCIIKLHYCMGKYNQQKYIKTLCDNKMDVCIQGVYIYIYIYVDYENVHFSTFT